jgi:hypothetical protein
MCEATRDVAFCSEMLRELELLSCEEFFVFGSIDDRSLFLFSTCDASFFVALASDSYWWILNRNTHAHSDSQRFFISR